MHIKLIQPKMSLRPVDTKLKSRMAPSLGILTIANIFRKENIVTIENENVKSIDFEEKVDLVGISVTVDVLPRAIEISNQYRKKGIPVVAGGIHISSCPNECEQYFDVICVGPSENIWRRIVSDYKQNSLKRKYIYEPIIDDANFTSPAYDLVDSSKYLYCNIIYTSYGCPFRCSFCYNSCDSYESIYVNRPIDKIIEEIKLINRKHIMFIDDNFIGNPKWTLDFVKSIRDLKIKWNAAVSTNICEMPELLDEMRLSGCQGLFIGFESLCEKAIKSVNKNQNVINKYDKLVNEIHKRGIMINASFVFGLDCDDISVFQRTVDWVVKNKIETVTSHILTPYPGTNLYNSLYSDGRITSFDLSKYNTSNVVFKPKNMTEEELLNGYLWVYKKIYSYKNIIRRIPRARNQIIPYLLFNLFYRKFGKVSEFICEKMTYESIGTVAAKLSKYLS